MRDCAKIADPFHKIHNITCIIRKLKRVLREPRDVSEIYLRRFSPFFILSNVPRILYEYAGSLLLFVEKFFGTVMMEVPTRPGRGQLNYSGRRDELAASKNPSGGVSKTESYSKH